MHLVLLELLHVVARTALHLALLHLVAAREVLHHGVLVEGVLVSSEVDLEPLALHVALTLEATRVTSLHKGLHLVGLHGILHALWQSHVQSV